MLDLGSRAAAWELMRAHDRLDAVALAEGLGDVGAKGGGEGAAAGADRDAWLRLRVRPQRVEEQPVVARLEHLRRVPPVLDLRDVVERDVVLAEEAAVDDEGPLAW